MGVTVIDPSDLAPEGFMPSEPDIMAASAPDGPTDQQKPGTDTVFLPGGMVDTPDEEPAPAPAPAAPRPVVRYTGGNGDVSHPLRYPVEIDGVKYRRVVVSPPSLWDVQDFMDGRIRTNVELVARMTGLDPVAFGAFKWPDVQAMVDIALGMVPDFIRKQIDTRD